MHPKTPRYRLAWKIRRLRDAVNRFANWVDPTPKPKPWGTIRGSFNATGSGGYGAVSDERISKLWNHPTDPES